MQRRGWATGFGGYLLALCALLAVQPFIAFYELGRGFFELAVTLVLIAGALGASRKRSERLTVAVLVVLTSGARWGALGTRLHVAVYLANVTALLFFAYTAVLILRAVLSRPEVTVDTLYGAVVVYLLTALSWALLYDTLDLAVPGSFLLQGHRIPAEASLSTGDFIYFSFVTLTSLGYGDIVPGNPIARTFAIFEVAFGQLYLALTIGRLLGLHLRSRPS